MTVAAAWAACTAAQQRGDRLGLLLAAARLECGLSDRWSAQAAEVDDESPRRQAAVRWSQAAAEWYLKGRTEALLPDRGCPWEDGGAVLHCSDPEGLRYYSLNLDGYAVAARRWQAAAAADTPAWVLGLRTMGSTLAPMVWAALRPPSGDQAHRCTTLRPQGDPQRRVIRISDRLRQRMQAWWGAFLIIDEGPGLSGSSFAGTVMLLQSLGVSPRRIALLPSWEVDAAAAARLSSPIAACQWTGWRCYPADPLTAPEGEPLHGGVWRQRLRHSATTPVWGTHERLKFLTDGGRTITKFAGVGPYGVATWERARHWARAGWGPAVVSSAAAAAAGWVVYRRVRVRPLAARPGRAWAEWAGDYLAWIRSEFPLGGPAPPTAELAGMLRVNLERLSWPMTPPSMVEAVPVALDARLQRCEWGAIAGGQNCPGGPSRWMKFDGTDHGDDPFFPGPADVAWDVAAMAVEFGPTLGAAVLAAYSRRSGETAAALAPRLAWHRLAYGAFRAAFCAFAATQVAPTEAVRFRRAGWRYRAAVERAAG